MDKIAEILANKWYFDCLVYNIPVSPSDVKDVVEELLELKKEKEELEETKMKKYELKDYKEFCREALVCPPIEEFDEGTIDEDEWYKQHDIRIITGNHEINIGYGADEVNEIEFALREIYEAVEGDGTATTGNTVGSEYRPAEIKDIIHVAIQNDWKDWGWKMDNFGAFIKEFIKHYDDIANIFGVYDIIYEDVKHYTEIFKCNFGKLNMYTLKHIDKPTIKRVISELVGTDIELLVGYDNMHRCSDITFIMDHTFKDSGELIGWFYGEQDEDYINELIADYKKKLFGEE